MAPSFLPNRRSFLQHGGSCGAYLLALHASMPGLVRGVFQSPQENEKLFEEKWGWIEKLSQNVWSHVATPFDDRDFTTVCNGGIIAGKERVLAIESFQTPKGAEWLANRARELTGRWPTDVVVTHFHGDHVSGSPGYKTGDESPRMWVTEATRELVHKDQAGQGPVTLLDDLSTIDAKQVTTIDLGGVEVRLTPAGGHTDSDVIVEVVDPNIVFSGDLFWNRLVPNFRDADASRLKQTVKTLFRSDDTLYVPGHGPLAGLEDLKRYQEFLGEIEIAATAGHAAGEKSAFAATKFQLSGKLGDWFVFSDRVLPGAFAAWYRSLDVQKKKQDNQQ